ncbi:MAG: UPF0489 family protein [Candidatus Peribacteria bacterium]|jgi:hypothetical protein|nr:UPF0489 family protein [Candidatus Peribacteria bacterium]
MQFAHPHKPLRVAPLVEVSHFSELEKNLAVEENYFAFAEKESGFHGLQTFLKYGKHYLFDNHHHALYFWYQSYLRTHKLYQIIHIDQHSDLWESQFSLPVEVLQRDCSREVFEFVQGSCNVGNFIQPALKSGLISEVQLVLTEYRLQHLQPLAEPYLLDIDLDFFAPEMGIEIEKYLPVLKTLAEKAEGSTIATSPYFLKQRKAIALVKKILQCW